MFGDWAVGIVMNFTSNGAITMARLASQTRMANVALSAHQGLIGKNALAMEAYRNRIDAVRMSALGAGAAIAGALAAAGTATIGSALKDASELQQILLSIKNETGASNAQIGGFYNTAFKIANQNGMTPAQGGEILRTISRLTAGQFDVNKMMAIAPSVAAFASAIHFNRPDISVDDAAKTGISTAHLFRAYDPAALGSLLDKVYRLSGLMAETPDQALRQMSYYVPMFKALGVSDSTSIATMALLDRAGFRNKVGTNVRAEVLEALGPLQLTQHAQAGKMGLLTEMGLFKNGKFAWNTQSGGLDFFGELTTIGNWAQSQRAKGVSSTTIAQEMFGALGKQGGTIGALFLDQQMPGILRGINAYLGDPKVGLPHAKANRDQSAMFQWNRAVGNFKGVMIELAYPWLTKLTGVLKSFADSISGFTSWLHGHPTAEKAAGVGVAGGTALLGLGSLFAGLQIMIRSLGGPGIVTALRGISPIFEGIMGGVRVFAMSVGLLFPWVGRLATFGLRLVPIVGWIVTAIEVLRHAADIAWILGKITGFMQYKLWPGIVNEWQVGMNWVGSAFQAAIRNAMASVTAFMANPTGSINNSANAWQAAKDAWWANVFKSYQQAHDSEKPGGDVNLTVHVHGGGNAAQHGAVAGQAIVHELRKAGIVRNGARWGGHAIPAAH